MADIPVNADQWNALEEDEQQRIEKMLREVELLGEDDKIIADPEVEPFEATAVVKPQGWVCELACRTAAAAGRAACASLGHPAAIAACLLAVREAERACLRKC